MAARSGTAMLTPPVTALLATLVLGGCQSLPAVDAWAHWLPAGSAQDDAQAPPAPAAPRPAHTDPVIRYVATAHSGVEGVVVDAAGRERRVIARDPYFAASGRTCRAYAVFAPGRGTLADAGLLCRGADGAWQPVDLLVNPAGLHNRPRAGARESAS